MAVPVPLKRSQFQGLASGRLLQPSNIASLIQQNAHVLILAVGMLMIIVAGHIDLSVGSVVAYVGIPASIVTLAGMLIFRGVELEPMGIFVVIAALFGTLAYWLAQGTLGLPYVLVIIGVVVMV